MFLEKIKLEITKKINKALKQEIVNASNLVYPPDEKMGDLSLPCFEIAKAQGKNPAEISQNLAKKIKNKKYEAKAVGPYLNFIINADVVVQGLKETQKNIYGWNKIGARKKVMIEFANQNTHKEVHIGHLRNFAYGDSVNKILKANGYDAIPVSYINDFGIHVAKTLWYYKNIFKKKEKELGFVWDTKGALLGRLYAAASSELENNEEGKKEVGEMMKKIESRNGKEYKLWQTTRKWSIKQHAQIYKELGIKFKEIFYENDFVVEGFKLVEELQAKGILKKSEGAIIADLNEYDLGVLLFLRTDGTALYAVADLPLAKHRFEKYKLDKLIYVVDVRQGLHFKQLFKVLELLGHKEEKLHLGYDFVKLPSGMMASRTGNIITYEQLKFDMLAHTIEETKKRHADWSEEKIEKTARAIAFGAMKFEMIKVAKEQIITFDIKEAVRFDGFTSAYLQYTVARINSVIRKSEIQNSKFKIQNLREEKEKHLILKMLKYPEVIEKAGEKFDPSEIAKYLFELAQMFNDYYHSIPVLKAEEEIKNARLSLLDSVNKVITNGLALLGIETVEEM